MKKTLTLLLAAALSLGAAFEASAQQLKLGTVDMKKVFESYYKTKDAEQRINEARNSAKKELEDRMDIYKKSMDDVNKLNDEIQKPELSKEAKEAKTKQRDDRIGELKTMQREIQDFQTNREKQLNEQQLRMRGGIVDEIDKVVTDRVKADQYDIVLDKSGPSMNGVPIVLYAKDSYDFTADVIVALNKNRPKEDASAPASSASTPTADPAAAATPKAVKKKP